jgi:hypothetical protein
MARLIEFHSALSVSRRIPAPYLSPAGIIFLPSLAVDELQNTFATKSAQGGRKSARAHLGQLVEGIPDPMCLVETLLLLT